MKTNIGSRIRIIALSLLILSMIIMMYNDQVNIKYWIAITIIVISLGVINYDYFILYKNKKKEQTKDLSKDSGKK
ncbi:MAG: hypothetical protein WCL51_08815 [Bacteroidota bacterium]